MTWTKAEIEHARSRPLAPVLIQAGYELDELPNGAMLVTRFRGMVVRGNSWFWKEQNLKGNTIDFFMLIEARTFSETMAILCPSQEEASSITSKRKHRAAKKETSEEDQLPL